MSMRSIPAIIFLFVFVAAAAWQPELRDAGDAAEMRLHWRVKPALRDSARWGLAWNIVDSANYEAVEAVLGDGRYDDAFGREEARLSHFVVRDGCRNLVRDYKLASGATMRSRGCSMRLVRRQGASEATLEVGATMPEVCLNVRPIPGTHAAAWAATPVDTLANDWTSFRLPEPVYAGFPDVDSLRRYLLEPADANEAEWVLYDMQGEPSRIISGGRYRIATVAAATGGYDIYYVDGADVNADQWRPLRLKGRLLPTGFLDRFELYWLDAFGEELPAESAAHIENGSLLQLSFPLNNARMRFRRVISEQYGE